MSFGDDLRAFQTNTNAKLNLFVKNLVSEVALSLIVKSPVGDPELWASKPPKGYEGGQFRANWNYSLAAINPATTNAIDPDGGPTLDKIVGSIPEDAIGSVHFVTNSLPYAIRLENGHSTQAPFGMVTLTIIEFSQMIDRAIANVSLSPVNGREIGL